jgi:hypothetical protein
VEKVLKISDINTLTPAFNGVTGWVSSTELTLLDPDCDRFEIIDMAEFEDGSVFMDIIVAGWYPVTKRSN